ncbi:MAG TPA: hypothetical protein VGO66_01255 [Solirubrobacterales bacterium]|nr:hypothetical protein [Solirubrobacterales bacterium]
MISASLAAGASAAKAPLVFERDDGLVIRFSGTPRVWCGPWDEEVARRSVHISQRGAKRGWELSAVRRDVKVGRPIEFPNEFVYTRPRRAQVFVYDAAIEASSAEEESSGSMVFSRLSCKLGGVVEFSIDAVLGSELSGEPVQVSGTYSGLVSKRP